MHITPGEEACFLKDDTHARLIARGDISKFYVTACGLQKSGGYIEQG